MKQKKTSSARISIKEEEFLVENFGTPSAGLSHCVDIVQQSAKTVRIDEIVNLGRLLDQIRRYSLKEIQNVFSENEWKYMADALNGTMITTDFRCMQHGLIASVEDSDTFDSLAEKWEVNIKQLISKIQKLTGAQIDAVYYRVEQFWKKPDNLKKWAKW